MMLCPGRHFYGTFQNCYACRMKGGLLSFDGSRSTPYDRSGMSHTLALRGTAAGDIGSNGLGYSPRDESGGFLFLFPAYFSYDNNAVRAFIVLKEFEDIWQVAQDDGICAQAHYGALADAALRQNAGEFIRKRAAAGNDPDASGCK